MANTAGEYTIPGASIVADGNQMVSNSVKVKVLPQDQASNGGQNDGSSSARSSSGTSVSNQDLLSQQLPVKRMYTSRKHLS